jgi:hypothetical protein
MPVIYFLFITQLNALFLNYRNQLKPQKDCCQPYFSVADAGNALPATIGLHFVKISFHFQKYFQTKWGELV